MHPVKSNYHTHSTFCDGVADPGVMAAAASAAGYDILGFSSHAPLPFPTGWNLPLARLDEYVRTIRDLQALWKPGGLDILLGLEIDWIGGQSSPADPAWDAIDLDFRIGSVHFVLPVYGEQFAVDEPEADFLDHLRTGAGGDIQEVYRLYYENLASMVESGGFDILGHLDLVRKNNRSGMLFDEDGRHYLETALAAAETLRGRDIVVEVNVGGLARGKTSTPYPSLAILRKLREWDVPITFCDDAHRPAHLGKHWGDARDAAIAAGYRSIAVLSHGVWVEREL